MLNCKFDYQRADFNLNIQLEMQHPILGIVGSSGSGKTTLLKNIAGLLNPKSGDIQLGSQTLFASSRKINLAPHQRQVALVFQQALLFPHLNVQQNLKYAEKLQDSKDVKFHSAQIVELLELEHLIQRKAHQLSGGEAQRVCIGRALLSSPNLLLLDEPLTGLDRQLKQQILPFLKRIKDELDLPMIYVTHHIDELKSLDAEILTMHEGRLLA
ncbi:ATP-binding cassette domain-containing protein [Acinetobacter sp. ANC 4173]|jgi:molybdate transport system ATP-binding protein|uniref:ATP-binding cassette domain-containing protein n=1 Tax=Acinetobacter sp. ANC 4173 TaxID=2529837 RepID=UPI0010390926|nr:ATP-binding cassette domain-containing protein [Acinetobacter sp. ANC 4173]TCB79123.1 ATP-binding cassette domain-containing protein [Acinetobacter sp. ANC 4173]